MPARKKHSTARARANKASTAATLTRDVAVADPEVYRQLTVAKLRAEIDQRNSGRLVEAKLSKRGPKANLVTTLLEDDDDTPALPDREDGWHPMTRTWWADIWASPMASEWDDSDVHNVYILAALFDDIWRAPSASARKDAMGEYRLQRVDLGLSPYSRRRLEWTIETADEARDRGKQRRSRGPQNPPTGQQQKHSAEDPRSALYAVK